MPPRISLRSFLASARAALASPKGHPPFTFVVGNESADLDSLCSAIILAYFRTQNPPYKLHIPIANIPRADLRLRREFTFALQRANLEPSDILTLSDVTLDPKLTSELDAAQVLLVDHNSITGLLAKRFADRVVGCIDHHHDEGAIPQDTTPGPRIIEKCGSCSSLVVDYCRPIWATLDKDADADTEMAMIALAPVLIDTSNLSNHQTTPKDSEAVAFLITIPPSSFSKEKYFEELSEAKNDISAFTFREIWEKDYKEWEEFGELLGISTVVRDMNFLKNKAGEESVLLLEVRNWVQEKNLSIFAIMTVSIVSGELERNLFMWGLSERGAEAAKLFEEANRKILKLEASLDGILDGALDLVPNGTANQKTNGATYKTRDETTEKPQSPRQSWFRAWRQGANEMSRKQVAVMIRTAMKEAAKR